MRHPVRPLPVLLALLALPACGFRMEAPRDEAASKEMAGAPASAPVAADMAVASRLAETPTEAGPAAVPDAT